MQGCTDNKQQMNERTDFHMCATETCNVKVKVHVTNTSTAKSLLELDDIIRSLTRAAVCLGPCTIPYTRDHCSIPIGAFVGHFRTREVKFVESSIADARDTCRLGAHCQEKKNFCLRCIAVTNVSQQAFSHR